MLLQLRCSRTSPLFASTVRCLGAYKITVQGVRVLALMKRLVPGFLDIKTPAQKVSRKSLLMLSCEPALVKIDDA